MDPRQVRDRSLLLVKALGYPLPPEHFPVLAPPRPRTEQAVIERALILHVLINCAFEMPIQLAWAWLDRERLTDGLTAGEKRYLDAVERGDLAPDAQGHRRQSEALCALGWALSLVPALDFGSHFGSELTELLPDLREDEGGGRFRKQSRLRGPAELLEASDLVYCLSWGIANANLTRTPVPDQVPQYVIWQRRRALAWLLHEKGWDDPDLSTLPPTV